MEHCDTDYYADDVTVHTHGNIQTEIESKLQHDGNNTKLWCQQNKMEINYDKNYMYDRRNPTQNKNIQPLNINIDGNKIINVKNSKLLGVYIDENLRWTDLFDHFAPLSHPKFHY